MDRRDAKALQVRKQAAHVRRDRSRVVERAEGPDPRVKELDRLGTGSDLGPQISDRHIDQAGQESVEGRGLGVHQRFEPDRVA